MFFFCFLLVFLTWQTFLRFDLGLTKVVERCDALCRNRLVCDRVSQSFSEIYKKKLKLFNVLFNKIN